ncbi:hypothetical protein B0H10DRAFT_2209865 [Mycena sp. CBHHK59/15]|nr:hypothetical protein B0H10DRAFT_2209865 [Mycena sp. CBHHK59/15]
MPTSKAWMRAKAKDARSTLSQRTQASSQAQEHTPRPHVVHIHASFDGAPRPSGPLWTHPRNSEQRPYQKASTPVRLELEAQRAGAVDKA